MPTFQYPAYLWLLTILVIPVALYIYAIRQKKAMADKIGDPSLVRLLLEKYNPAAYRLKWMLGMIAMLLLVITLANPRKVGGVLGTQREGIDVMLALDVSKSMLAKDISPSRLERARQLMGRLVDQLGNNRVGMVLFAGKAYLQMPLTSDHAAARMYISVASPENVPTQGTVIADALNMCNQSFNSKEKKYKTIILISDGEDHDESAVKAAKQLSEQGVVIHSIGIGSPTGSALFDEETNSYKKDQEGNTVISRLNEDNLRNIAEAGNGTYRLYDRTDAVAGGILAELARMDQRSIRDDSNTQYVYFFPWILALALMLLLAEFFIREQKRKRIKQGFLATVISFCCFLMGNVAMAQEPVELVQQGNDTYSKGEFSQAAEKYQEALNKKGDYAEARYNLGNALYKSGKKEDAVAEYKRSVDLLSDPKQKSNAWYNQGVVWQGEQKLPESIDAYKQALRLDPSNEDARINLQQALREQQKQKEKQEEQKKQEKKDQKKDKDKKEQNPDKQKQDQDKKDKQPEPKLSKKEAENRLKALLQQEKNLQEKMRRLGPATTVKPEKDW